MVAKFLILALLSATLACFNAKEIRTSFEHEPSKTMIDKNHEIFSGYFNEDWKQIYNKDQLLRQPKWKLAKKQPVDASYEVREYDAARYVTSHIPCVSQVESASKGYIRLHFYMRAADLIFGRYPLTYPILSKIEINAEEKPVNRSVEDERDIVKDRVTTYCPDRFSQHFYLPIPATQTPHKPTDPTISIESVPAKTYYVRRYEDKFTLKTQSNCNIQAGYLAAKLALSGVRFDPRSYYCAMYHPGSLDNVTALFEVWFAAQL